MKKLGLILSLALVPFFSQAEVVVEDGKPDKITATKIGRGPDGYDEVKQEWTSDTEGTLDCNNAGTLSCEWRDLSVNGGRTTVNVSELFDLAINGAGDTGSFEYGSTTIDYVVLERLGDGQGTVEFDVNEG